MSMMRLWCFLCVIGFGLLYAKDPVESSPAKAVIAVGEFEANGVSKSDAGILTDRLRAELINTGVFRVMERSQMEAILKEQSFQQSGACTSSECQVQVGQLLGVDRMVAGIIGLLGGDVFTVSTRMLDVQTGEVLFTVSQDYQGPISGMLSKVIPEVARKLGNQAAVVRSREVLGLPTQTRLGDMVIETSPPGASVLVDGKLQHGVTPLTIRGVVVGVHNINVRLNDQVGSSAVTLAPDDLLKVTIPLQTGLGGLKVFCQPQAMVSLDGKLLGSTPLKLDGIKMGQHQLNISAKGFAAYESSLLIEPGVVAVWNDSLQLQATLDLTVEPADAMVYLGNMDEPQPQMDKHLLPPGNLALRVLAQGYEPFNDTLQLVAGNTTQRVVKLKPLFGQLMVETHERALVKLDGNDVGPTPARLEHVSAGVHYIQVSAEGFEPIQEKIDIQRGSYVTRSYVLIPMQAWKDSVAQSSRSKRHWAERICAGTALVGGLAYAIEENFNGDKSNRNFGGVFALLGAVGLGLSFAF